MLHKCSALVTKFSMLMDSGVDVRTASNIELSLAQLQNVDAAHHLWSHDALQQRLILQEAAVANCKRSYHLSARVR